MPFVRIETRKLMALQALLALLQHRRHRPTLKRLVQDQGNALTNLRDGDRRGPFFSPARFPAPETRWPVTRAFDDAATRSNGALHSPPNRLRSCCAGDMLQSDVPPWPPGPTPPAGSLDRHWTEKSRLSRPVSWSRSRERITVNNSSSPCCRRWFLETTRRVTISTTRGPLAPSRTSMRCQAEASTAWLQAWTLCQGRVGRRPFPAYAGSAVSRSRIAVCEGTASRYRSCKAVRRRRNQDGRPISSSPALHRWGSAARWSASISKTNW